MKVGFDTLYSQDATAHHGIGNYSFSHLTYLRMRDEIDPYFFFPKYSDISRKDFAQLLTRFLVDNQIDIFHLPSPMTFAYPDVFFSGEIPKVRVSATVYDLIPLLFPDIYLSQPEGRQQYQRHVDLIKRAHHLLAISENTRSDLMNIGIPGDKITVISAGQDETYYPFKDANTKSLNSLFPAQVPFILAFNAVDFRKNAERLLKGFALAAKSHLEPWQLVFVNHIPDTVRQDLDRLAAQLGVRHQVHHLGRVDRAQLLRLYNKAQAVVMPTLYEGLGLPVLEAMQCQTPVLVSNTSSLPELVGDAALKVDPRDVNSIAAGLLQLMSSAKLRSQLAQQSLERAQQFDWKQGAQRTVQAFSRIMEIPMPSYADQGYSLEKVLANMPVLTRRNSVIELQPNRYRNLRYLRNKKLRVTFVSFNVAALPPGSVIESAVLRIRVANPRTGVRIHRIRRGWDVRSIRRRRPGIWRNPAFILRPSAKRKSPYIEWNCTNLARRWQRYHLQNHGLYLRQAALETPTLVVKVR